MTTEANRPARIEGAKNDGASPDNKALAGAPDNKAAGTGDQGPGCAGRPIRRHLPRARSRKSGHLHSDP